MENMLLIRVGLFALGTLLVVVDLVRFHRRGGFEDFIRLVLGVIAVASLLWMGFVWLNHISFSLNLDLMEGVVLQHLQRALEFKAIYPEPTSAYVPLAYNPLYYVLAVPFAWAFGANLFTLRLVAILGTIGSGWIVYYVVQDKTRSKWWGLIAVGFFVAAYRVMDAYLDTAHSDSWLLCSVLLGSYVIDRNRSRAWNLLGVVILVAAFWFKQHGALFAIGGVLYLTWREGVKRSWPYWLSAAILGPGLYILGGPWLFGSHFLYFTWQVPARWSELNLLTLHRYIGFIVKSYPILALSGGLLAIWTGTKERQRLDIWHVQFIFALLAGLMGTLDAGSSDNVYIPMGVWFILLGTVGLAKLGLQSKIGRYEVHLIALFASFSVLLYNPVSVIVSPHADESYADLIVLLDSLDGQVYAPSLGQLQSGHALYPAAHWVALEDVIRGPGRDTRNHPQTRALLEPALNPSGEAYILANYPLDTYPWIAFLEDYYVLESDLGDRFQALRALSSRWDHGWPRYLYRYAPEKTDPSDPG